ncbi:MAG: hypothetical protein ACOX4P_04450 [Anaerovoracaceae bacterium]|jgi:N6-L-threonylcarbamoyladenine synthase
MDKNTNLVLSLDTSNYTTSLAVINRNKEVIIDKRKTLKVKEGERGLRQSYALFQHMENLPDLIEQACSNINTQEIRGIAVSNRPRPVEGSYMPVFNAGVGFGRTIAASLAVPLLLFSHQEGHLAAAAYNNPITINDHFLAFHLSGGTCELLNVNSDSIKKIGGSKDISFGQVLDRLGVAMGFAFPSGMKMDELAINQINQNKKKGILKPIPLNGLDINLSGFETQAERVLETDKAKRDELIHCIFSEITSCLIKWTEKAVNITGCNKVLFSGGVAASEYLRKKINYYFNNRDITIGFGQASLSSDNAVGIGLLGVKNLWQ